MVNSNIFLGSGASTVLVPEQDLYIPNVTQDKGNANKLNFVNWAATYELVTNLYIGCEFEVWQNDTTDVLVSTHTVKSNTGNSLISSSTVKAFATTAAGAQALQYYIIIKDYGTPSPSSPSVPAPATRSQRLNADNWIGLAETVTFPTLEQDIKQMNLGLGGTRNWSYQYKGIRTASGGSLALTANNGAWLYYALGQITNVDFNVNATPVLALASGNTDSAALSMTIAAGGVNVTMTTLSEINLIAIGMTVVSTGLSAGVIESIDYSAGTFRLTAGSAGTPATVTDAVFTLSSANRQVFHSDTDNTVFIYDTDADGATTEHANTGPIMYRTVKDGVGAGSVILPPLNPILFPDPAQFEAVTRSSLAADMITYTITEGNTSDLPSFTMEQSLSKDPSTLTTSATSTGNEDTSFTRIARGNRVNSLTLEAAEGEEVKFNVDLNSRLVDSITDIYQKAGVAPTYEARNGKSDNEDLFNWNAGTNSGAPFFFSSGSLEAFGQQFLKVSSISIEIANNLIDKRYMGGHRDMKEGIAAQRAYTISFSAIVTDDEIFKFFLKEDETTGTAAANVIKLRFDKDDNDEFMELEFKNYFLDTANWTIPDDKGPVTIEATIKPRDLKSCSIGTDWVLQG